MSRSARPFITLIAVILLRTTVCRCDDPLPPAYLEKVDTTPDFCQVDHRFGKFPGNGDELCGPVALSNALIGLNQQGFPKLINRPKPTQADQADLIRRLRSQEYLDTNLEVGTNPRKIVQGIEKKTEPCQLVALPADHHLVSQSGETRKADGYFQLQGIHHRKEIDLAIVDGAIAFAPIKPAKEN